MNTLKLDITELEIDEQENKISQRDYDKYFEYNETFKSQIILPPNAQYSTITFSEVTNPFSLIIISDKLIDVNVNGFEIKGTKMILLNTEISSLQIKNVDLASAVVSVYIWGKSV